MVQCIKFMLGLPVVNLYLSATASNLSGLNVPSVSIYKHLPSAPPWSMGSYKKAIEWTNKILYERLDIITLWSLLFSANIVFLSLS